MEAVAVGSIEEARAVIRKRKLRATDRPGFFIRRCSGALYCGSGSHRYLGPDPATHQVMVILLKGTRRVRAGHLPAWKDARARRMVGA